MMQLTEEQRKAIIDRAKVIASGKFGHGEDERAMAEIALAALTAEPRGYIDAGTPNDEINILTENKILKTDIALYTAPPATAPAVPDGWKLVPIEPSWEMLAADGCKEHHKGQPCSHHDNRRRIWSAMLAATPSPSDHL